MSHAAHGTNAIPRDIPRGMLWICHGYHGIYHGFDGTPPGVTMVYTMVSMRPPMGKPWYTLSHDLSHEIPHGTDHGLPHGHPMYATYDMSFPVAIVRAVAHWLHGMDSA